MYLNRKAIFDEILEERSKQIEKKGFSDSHDSKWSNGELARAASVYAMPHEYREYVDTGFKLRPYEWPWSDDDYKPTPENRKKELIKAAALIVAEIERLDALEENLSQKSDSEES